MPFAFITIGLIMVITGVKGTHAALGAQLQKDFTGDRNFVYWLLAIGVVGSLGYVESMKTFSRLFLLLIVVAMILKNGGFAEKLMQALAQGPQKISAPSTTSGTTRVGVDQSSTNVVSKVADFAKIVAIFA